jgi:hypothetical protein
VNNQPLAVYQYPRLATNWSYETSYPDRVGFLPKNDISEPVTMETVVEYIVATYGHDKLQQLIDAMGQYPTPETLIPALFGVSQADFEAGWQAYLAQHYQE